MQLIFVYWICILQPGFNFLSLLCFLDCNSKHVHPAGGNTVSIENEKCKDLYGILFGSLPKLIYNGVFGEGANVGTSSGIFRAVQGRF